MTEETFLLCRLSPAEIAICLGDDPSFELPIQADRRRARLAEARDLIQDMRAGVLAEIRKELSCGSTTKAA